VTFACVVMLYCWFVTRRGVLHGPLVLDVWWGHT
jgi:hypothetical protein